jgi:rhodanese-related sulfurtransferase
MKRLFAVLLVSVFGLTSCGTTGGNVTNLSVSEFASKIKENSVILIDVRTPAEFATGHISGATNIDFESGTFSEEIQKLDKTKTYAVYCRSGNRSGQATALMEKEGFISLYNLSGGVIEWSNVGKELVIQ